MKRAGMTIDDVDLVEINEAFAAQVIPSYQDLGIDLDKLNVNGGSVAIGHPFAATGARLVGTLAKLLAQKGAGRGLVTVCTAGGMGVAAILEIARMLTYRLRHRDPLAERIELSKSEYLWCCMRGAASSLM